MYKIHENDIDHSKNGLNTLSMRRKKKEKSLAKTHLLPSQYQNNILSNLQEFTIKKCKIKFLGFEASSKKFTSKFYNPNLKTMKSQKIKKEKTIWDKLWLLIKQFINFFFQFLLMHYQQFIP